MTLDGIADSGADAHLTGDSTLFIGFVCACHVPVNGIAGLAGGLIATGVGRGRIFIGGVCVDLSRLYYVPGAVKTLISISELVEDGCRVIAEKVCGAHVMTIEMANGKHAQLHVEDGLYAIPNEGHANHAVWEDSWKACDQTDELHGCAMVMGKSVGNTHVGDLSLGQLYHGRLGHFSSANKRLARRVADAFGAKAAAGCSMAACEACARAKMGPMRSRARPTRPATRPLERVHLDLSPALPTKSTSGATGFLVIVDEGTGYYFVQPFVRKSEVYSILVAFKAWAEKHFRQKMGSLLSPFELSGIRSDGEGQNTSGLVKDWCRENGINREISAPYSQHQDGIAERAIQTLWWGSEALRKAAGAPPSLWERTIQAFAHVKNRMALGESDRSPWEKWNGVTIDMKTRLQHVRIWGTKCYAYVPKELRDKFGDRARVCVMFGYSKTSKAYVLYDLRTRVVFEASSVMFDETEKPFQNGAMREAMLPVPPAVESAMSSLFGSTDKQDRRDQVETNHDIRLQLVTMEDDSGGTAVEISSAPANDQPEEMTSPAINDTIVLADVLEVEAAMPRLEERVKSVTHLDPPPTVIPPADREAHSQYEASQMAAAAASDAAIAAAGGSEMVDGVRRGVRQRTSTHASRGAHEPKHGVARSITGMQARLAQLPVAPPVRASPSDVSISRISGQVNVPYVSEVAVVRYRLGIKMQTELSARDKRRVESRIEKLELIAASSQLSARPPSTHVEALAGVNGLDWLSSMRDELGAMSEFGVWRLVPEPPGAQVVGCKWVFALKRDKHGFVRRLKSRLVLKGYAQTAGVDYIDGETWAPTCRMRVFRWMMQEASSRGMRTAQWDCTSAFLHADLDIQMFMKQPPGFEVDGKVCELLKSIYGSKQASRLWYGMVRDRLMSLSDRMKGCIVRQSLADECFFNITRGGKTLRILLHVDDFAVTSDCDDLYDDVFSDMKAIFKITDYDGLEMSHYLGIAVERVNGDIHLSQEAYVDELLDRIGMTHCAGAATPEVPGTKAKLRTREHPMSEAETALMEAVPYKAAVSALFYIARATRPEIVRAVGQVARFMENPAPEHWEAVERIYRYVKRTKATPLVMRATSNEKVSGFSDADWAGDYDTSKSHSGWLVMSGGSPVAWYSKKQSCISQSSCEAEYVAAASLSNELVWWRQLLMDVGCDTSLPLEIFSDNKAAGVLAQHSGNFERTKHIRLRYHVLRARQADGEVVVRWCPASEQLADIFTKNTAVGHFKTIASRILGASIH